MKPTKKLTRAALVRKLEEVGIKDTISLVGHGGICIVRRNADKVFSRRFVVLRPGFITDYNAHPMNDFNKTITFGGSKDCLEVLDKIKDWASKKYGIVEWVKSPFGDWVSEETFKLRLKELIGEPAILFKRKRKRKVWSRVDRIFAGEEKDDINKTMLSQLENMSIPELRRFARTLKKLRIKGREITLSGRDELFEEITFSLGMGKLECQR